MLINSPDIDYNSQQICFLSDFTANVDFLLLSSSRQSPPHPPHPHHHSLYVSTRVCVCVCGRSQLLKSFFLWSVSCSHVRPCCSSDVETRVSSSSPSSSAGTTNQEAASQMAAAQSRQSILDDVLRLDEPATVL